MTHECVHHQYYKQLLLVIQDCLKDELALVGGFVAISKDGICKDPKSWIDAIHILRHASKTSHKTSRR